MTTDHDQPFNPMQAIVDGIGKQHEKKRAQTQLTLGRLIDILKTVEPARPIAGFGDLNSYRGYYSDLSFEPCTVPMTASALLVLCGSAMGRSFQGYKGGDFAMHENTPLWIAEYGCCGPRLMDLDLDADPIVPVTEHEEV